MKFVRLFQPRLKHTHLLNGAMGLNPICSGKQGDNIAPPIPATFNSLVHENGDNLIHENSDVLGGNF
jgi:hypothetical protein